MTVETEVANLTTAVDSLTAAVNVSKATLDASVADAQTHKTGAQAAQTGSEAARDLANQYKTDAQSVVSQDLQAIAALHGITPVAACIAHTGMAGWRFDASLSWYNEPLNTATRGATRPFPAKAAVILSVSDLYVFDMTMPAAPLFIKRTGVTNGILRRYSDQPLTAVFAVGSKVIVGSSNGVGHGGVVVLDFAADNAWAWCHSSSGTTTARGRYLGGIGDSESARGWSGEAMPSLSAPCVNAVAAHVYPDAPLDPVTGLQVPTIFAACGNDTTNGWSQIGWDGSSVEAVWDCTGQPQKVRWISVADNGDIFTMRDYSSEMAVFKRLSSDIVTSAAARRYYPISNTSSEVGKPRLLSGVITGFENGRSGASGGLTLLKENPADYGAGAVAYITADSNTGYMHGDCVAALFCGTDQTDLVGANLRTDPFDVVTDWVYRSGGSPTFVAVSGEGHMTKDATTGADAEYEIALVTTAGQYIRAEVEGWRVSGSGAARIRLMNAGAEIKSSSYATTVTHQKLVVEGYALSSDTRIRLVCGGGATAAVAGFDNLTIDIATQDHSPANNGGIVNGTITASPVATGAEAVKYGMGAGDSFHTGANIDPTGDFTMSFWDFYAGGDFYIGTTGATTYPPLAVNDGVLFRQGGPVSGKTPKLEIYASGNDVKSDVIGFPTSAIDQHANGDPVMVTYRRIGDDFSLFVNGELQQTVTDAAFALALDALAPQPLYGYVSEFREVIYEQQGNTDEQIAYAYHQGLKKMQPDAACTLGGSSDAVIGLAGDWVSTADGASRFEGLTRVEYRAGDEIIAADDTSRITDTQIEVDAMLLREYLARVDRIEDLITEDDEAEFFFTGDTVTTDFTLPAGWVPKLVFSNGSKQRPGSGEDFTVTYDGHNYTVKFAVAPAAVNIDVLAKRKA